MHPLHLILHQRITAIQALCEYDPSVREDYWVSDWYEGNLRYRSLTEELLSNYQRNI